MEKKVKIFKALSDKNRLLIIDMLSCGELCACDIMDGLELTQPTISHHMKILQNAGLVNLKKNGKWTIYSLNKEIFNDLCDFINHLSSYKENCICEKVVKTKCGKD
ncbi:ArsR/SmtB family transcription factor [Paramaledivibacter caminithermalis]|jgi:ArsR family transcriptional regulator|uniref:Transcriptional regulator, ArsR family n=1 Tax=Paramaledivibacter caminithermalis (strain DSM 15212 / CIP 107654 / DViRD3) TaxID=1121301 RepID=A0A1M6LXF5_PARC5|nr:metalloregulator ArsR/SmtB family transcription factor [Paramaledivibacter caminithermalis]SHJ75889.1 transcriptional regulator, ArsR family [Paramaledivibacter caminithermalis DSM 15212]